MGRRTSDSGHWSTPVAWETSLSPRGDLGHLMDARPNRLAAELERREGNRQAETPWPGASRIEVEHAADGFDLRPVRMTRYAHIDPGRRGIGVELLEVVKHINGPASERHACRVRVPGGPRSPVDVSPDGR